LSNIPRLQLRTLRRDSFKSYKDALGKKKTLLRGSPVAMIKRQECPKALERRRKL